MEKISLRAFATFLLLISAALAVNTQAAGTAVYINYVPPASNTLQQGFIRVTNQNASLDAAVAVLAINEKGVFSDKISVTFTVKPNETKQFTVSDLEKGNTTKGLTGAIGTGTGNWRLFVYSTSLVNVAAFVRTPDGFLSAIHDIAPVQSGGTVHSVGIFNPASNPNQRSKLHLINNFGDNNTFTITAIDDAGNPAKGGSLKITLGSMQFISLTSTDLEQGNKALGLIGAFGAGTGKWRLKVTSVYQSVVMSFMELPGGYFSNLSTTISHKTTSADTPTSCAVLNGASIYSRDNPSIFLGFFGSSTASLSVKNTLGDYGSTTGINSVRNKSSKYGASTGDYSSNNISAFYPPVIVKEGITLGYLSTSFFASNGSLSLADIDTACTGSSGFTASTPASVFAAYE